MDWVHHFHIRSTKDVSCNTIVDNVVLTVDKSAYLDQYVLDVDKGHWHILNFE